VPVVVAGKDVHLRGLRRRGPFLWFVYWGGEDFQGDR